MVFRGFAEGYVRKSTTDVTDDVQFVKDIDEFLRTFETTSSVEDQKKMRQKLYNSMKQWCYQRCQRSAPDKDNRWRIRDEIKAWLSPS